MRKKTIIITGGICITIGILLLSGISGVSIGGKRRSDSRKYSLSPEELDPFFDKEWCSFYGRMLTYSWVASPTVDKVAKKFCSAVHRFILYEKKTKCTLIQSVLCRLPETKRLFFLISDIFPLT